MGVRSRGERRQGVVPLPNSYHVATLDHDAELIFERTLGFIRAHAAEPGPPEAGGLRETRPWPW